MIFTAWQYHNASEIAKLEKEIFSDPWSENAVVSSIETEVFFGECLMLEEGDLKSSDCNNAVNCDDKAVNCDNAVNCSKIKNDDETTAKCNQEPSNSIIGYYGFYALPPEGHIANIAVKSGFRGKGIGKMLLERLLIVGSSMGCCDFTLEVRRSNLVAIKLYEKYGFKALGLRAKYYSDGEDAIIMWLKAEIV